MRFEGIGQQQLEAGTRIELVMAECRSAALPAWLPGLWWLLTVIIAPEFQKSID
jgi:hypothetical protein